MQSIGCIFSPGVDCDRGKVVLDLGSVEAAFCAGRFLIIEEAVIPLGEQLSVLWICVSFQRAQL